MNKYCRICWNTASWRGPTGEAKNLETGDSYVRKYGIGHEEWLFNFSWLQPGPRGTLGKYRYAFLQPINKYRKKYEKQTFNVFLYTVAPDKRRMAVATITDIFVPDAEELKDALSYMRKRGWLDEMEKNLAALGIPASGRARALKGPAENVINVRFSRSEVKFFEPGTFLPETHPAYRIDRYQPLDWHDDAFAAAPESVVTAHDGKRRSEEDITRAAVEGTIFSPGHVKLQNALCDYLQKLHGKKAVHYERARVDVELDHGGVVTVFEIKMALTAKSCIRQAIGQLLEYDIYPSRKRRSELVVVGEERCSTNDASYLKFLRTEHGIPIYYRRWNWEIGALEDGI